MDVRKKSNLSAILMCFVAACHIGVVAECILLKVEWVNKRKCNIEPDWEYMGVCSIGIALGTLVNSALWYYYIVR